ncbi:SUN domain-containing protein 3 [Tenebrio molitor]|uniref:SUN domain-containing protein 3 n=1 Tax=Tenebrio molitor TaxID=7067 RepID=UPI003624840D
MSCTSVTKSSEVSETDSETSYRRRRHPYNTRSSNKNLNARQVHTTKKLNQSRAINECLPTRKLNRKQGIGDSRLEEEDDPAMDYCFDPCETPPRDRRPSFCSFLLGSFYLLVFGGMLYMIYAQYLMNQELESIREDVNKVRGGNKKEDPHAKLFKELDKKCSDTLKLLLKDPVGRPDFALQSSGGQVIGVNTVPYSNPTTFLGFKLCEGAHSPSSMIQATASPGECWAFKGHRGSAILQLIDYVLIDSVTLEHIPHTISPSGTIDTAPKEFKIWGLESPHGRRHLLGQFKYESEGGTVQTFTTNNNSGYYKYVEFEVLSNHGNKDFTCVYRIRVHGTARKFA